MKVSLEISMYPLQDNYIPEIQKFIDGLNTHSNLEVRTNCMSTQVFGDYDAVMNSVQEEIKKASSEHQSISFVLKVIPKDLSDFE